MKKFTEFLWTIIFSIRHWELSSRKFWPNSGQIERVGIFAKLFVRAWIPLSRKYFPWGCWSGVIIRGTSFRRGWLMSNFLAILILTYISICCSKISFKMHIKLSVSILLFCFCCCCSCRCFKAKTFESDNDSALLSNLEKIIFNWYRRCYHMAAFIFVKSLRTDTGDKQEV